MYIYTNIIYFCRISLFILFYIIVFILHSHSLFLFLQIIKKPLGFELTIGHVLEFALVDMQPCTLILDIIHVPIILIIGH